MNIIKNKKIFLGISLAIIIVGMVMLLTKGFNYGIDFTGGTLIQIKIGKTITVDEAKEIVDEYDKNASILHAGAEKDEIIIKSTLDLSNDDITNIIDKFVEKYNIENKNYQSQKFGPFMGKEIRSKALLSALIATVAMLIYISWRFEVKFGIAAIVALVHDVLITLSVYAIFRIPVNSAFIAAILTILGYSINDTIVIFDRIRENLKLNPKESIDNIINNSIKQSLRRTINTSLTTLVSITVLYILGVEDVRVLAFPLIIGIISGTYSSLFIASPLWYDLKNRESTKTAI
ncbi:protein translocase subunit SecF [Tissierella sp. MSJ-40]|uniref:Protein-export membrane protein SecF n=1 Tax=Tissierella simiarum TaxID=2841534 RepID=A0ABS6E9P0_9FIRM|nr:protein translocase subunit SecF [Tissierella simiarum]MBU5439650.1 protein translocase subunit SecF [Tissierella simiarum]